MKVSLNPFICSSDTLTEYLSPGLIIAEQVLHPRHILHAVVWILFYTQCSEQAVAELGQAQSKLELGLIYILYGIVYKLLDELLDELKMI